MSPEHVVRRKLPGYATELIDWSSGRWELKAHDLHLLRQVLGESALWALARCFEAGERLMSLGFLVPSGEDHARGPAAALRNHWTAFWMSIGTMRELALALRDLRGIRKRLSGSQLRAWYRLEAVTRRWNDKRFVRVRNAMSFHLDSTRQLFRAGLVELLEGGEPLTLAGGDNPRHGASSFPFGTQIFILGLWPDPTTREVEFKALAKALVVDQTSVGALLQDVLVGLLRGGRHITPQSQLQRRRQELLNVLRARASTLDRSASA